MLVRDESTAKNIYFAEELLTRYGDFEILERVKGSELLDSDMNRCLIILLTSKLKEVLL